jgi:phosphoglycerate dehydrogenase-like enzyme/predicted dehydrogenase
MSATRSVRALVIGSGPAAVDMHFPVLASLQEAGRIELALLCDIDASRTENAARFGFRETSTDALAALARPDIEAVYIFASAQLHFEYGMAALQQGKHLFVEKPAAPNFSQALQLADAAERHKRIAVAGHNRRFYRSLAMVRERAGDTVWRSVEATLHKPEFGKPVPFGASSWLTANGIHALDAMIYMMGGPPDHVSAASSLSGAVAQQVFSALLTWRNGAQGSFLCNNSAGARREEYVFHGVADTYRVTDDAVSFEKGGRVETIPVQSLGDGIRAEHDAFLSTIHGGAEPVHSMRRIAPSLRIAELIEGGFSGEVEWPKAPRAEGENQRYPSHGILIARAGTMQAALAPLIKDYQLVSLEEIQNASGSQAHIVAAILGRGSPALSPELLAKLPNLRVVGVVGLSVAVYQPERLLAGGITLVNAGDAYANSVAEFALALAILGRRRAFSSHHAMRAGGWGTNLSNRSWIRSAAQRLRPGLRRLAIEQSLLKMFRTLSPASAPTGRPEPRQLRDALVGLIGWGQNAAAFAKLLGEIGAKVVVYSEHATANDVQAADARLVSLDEALAADIVSLHRGLTKQTRHFMGAQELNKLRAGSVLINVARGALIEPAALLERLKRGDIFACLDTFDQEPLDRASPLRSLPNVFLTSHIGGGSPDMHQSAAREVVAKVCKFLDGKPIAPLSRERLLTMT